MESPPDPSNNTFLGFSVITSDIGTGLLSTPCNLSFTVGLWKQIVKNNKFQANKCHDSIEVECTLQVWTVETNIKKNKF